MATVPRNIELTIEQWEQLAQLADQTGRPWSELLDDALRSFRSSAGTGAAEPRNRAPEGLSLAEGLARDGLLGCIKDAPPDLSTNPKYLEGFGLEEPSPH